MRKLLTISLAFVATLLTNNIFAHEKMMNYTAVQHGSLHLLPIIAIVAVVVIAAYFIRSSHKAKRIRIRIKK